MDGAIGTTQDRSLATYVEALDGSVSRLAAYIGNLRMVEGRFSSQLQGTTPAKDENVVSEKQTPSLESINRDFEQKLNELEEVVSALSKDVEPTGSGKVPG